MVNGELIQMPEALAHPDARTCQECKILFETIPALGFHLRHTHSQDILGKAKGQLLIFNALSHWNFAQLFLLAMQLNNKVTEVDQDTQNTNTIVTNSPEPELSYSETSNAN